MSSDHSGDESNHLGCIWNQTELSRLSYDKHQIEDMAQSSHTYWFTEGTARWYKSKSSTLSHIPTIQRVWNIWNSHCLEFRLWATQKDLVVSGSLSRWSQKILGFPDWNEFPDRQRGPILDCWWLKYSLLICSWRSLSAFFHRQKAYFNVPLMKPNLRILLSFL